MNILAKLKRTILRRPYLFATYLLALFAGMFVDYSYVLAMFMIQPLFLLRLVRVPSLSITWPLAFFVNIAYLVIASLALSLIGIGVSLGAIIAVSLLVVFLIEFYNIKIEAIKLPSKHIAYIFYIYLLFAFVTVLRAWAARDSLAPFLHDPIAHAYYADTIISTGYVEYWYSPGLHVISALFSLMTGATAAAATHIVSLIVSSVSILTWGIFSYLSTRKVGVATIASTLIAISPVIAFALVIAGKNSIITSLVFVPIAVYLTIRFTEAKTILNGVLLFLIVSMVGVTHSPAFAVVFAATGISIIIISLLEKSDHKSKGSLEAVKRTVISLWPLFLTALVVFVWYALSYKYLLSDRVDNLTPKSVFNSPAGTNRVEHFTRELITILSNPWGYFGNFLYLIYKPISVALIYLSLIFSLFVYRTKNVAIKKYQILTVSLLLVNIIYIWAIPLIGIRSTNIVRLSSQILIEPLTVAVAALAIWAMGAKFKISKASKLVLVSVAFLVVAYGLALQYQKYRIVSTKQNFVDHSDIQAYEWIDANIPDEAKFVNSAAKSDRRDIIYGSGGGVWLPVYTRNDIAMPFQSQSASFNSVSIAANYEQYQKLLSGESKAAQYFLDSGYQYVYHDKKSWLVDQALYTNIEGLSYLKEVYANSEVTIYEILR